MPDCGQGPVHLGQYRRGPELGRDRAGTSTRQAGLYCEFYKLYNRFITLVPSIFISMGPETVENRNNRQKWTIPMDLELQCRCFETFWYEKLFFSWFLLKIRGISTQGT